MLLVVSLPPIFTLQQIQTVLKSMIPTIICTSPLDQIFICLIKEVCFNSMKLVTTSLMLPRMFLSMEMILMPIMMKMSSFIAVME
eukprot:jgi/Orpsp1_1/1188274/evm.model.d7180000063567.1